MGDALPAEIDGFRRLWAWVHEGESDGAGEREFRVVRCNGSRRYAVEVLAFPGEALLMGIGRGSSLPEAAENAIQAFAKDAERAGAR